MKHIVQYSGGVGSAMAAYLVAQTQPKRDIILLFHDVRRGHDEDIYRNGVLGYQDDVGFGKRKPMFAEPMDAVLYKNSKTRSS